MADIASAWLEVILLTSLAIPLGQSIAFRIIATKRATKSVNEDDLFNTDSESELSHFHVTPFGGRANTRPDRMTRKILPAYFPAGFSPDCSSMNFTTASVRDSTWSFS